MTRTSLVAASIAAASLVLTTAGPAAAGSLEGGQEGITTQNSGQSSAAGPERAGLKWLSEELVDMQWARDRALTLDSEGHVLVPVHYRDGAIPRVEALIAVNRSDGKIAWQADGVETDCEPVASDDGVIYAQRQVGSEATSMIALDANDGSEIAGKEYTPPETVDEPRMFSCADGLSLLDDGTLIVVSNRGNDKAIRALDTTTTPISAIWHITRSSATMLGRAPASPDEGTIYIAWTDLVASGRSVNVSAIDVTNGDVLDTTAVPGNTLTVNSGQGDAFLVDENGGIILPTVDTKETGAGGDDTAHVTRLDPDLSPDWSITVGPGEHAVYPDKRSFQSLVLAGDEVVGWWGGTIAAVNLSDGSSAWTFKPSSFSNNESRIVADGAGNTYWGSFGGDWIQTVDNAGRLRWSFPNCAIGEPTEVSAIGPIDGEGTLYSVNPVIDSGGPSELVVTAIDQDGTLPQGTCPQGEQRLDGENRHETGIEISQDAFPQDGSAEAVVLARSDEYADALSGTPLAVQENGPLLITPPNELLDIVAAEIQRVLGDDTSKTVYLLGGEVALTPAVRAAVEALGYNVVRIAGADRILTAIEVAKALDEINAFLITTGFNYPDALAAGVAAAHIKGAVMLSRTEARAEATDSFMDANPGVPRYAIGGPAARPYPEAEALSGLDRIHTAILVALEFFDAPVVAGLARHDNYPDSLTGGAHVAIGAPDLARQGGPMLLTPTGELQERVATYLCDNEGSLIRVFVYGGESAIAASTASAADSRIQGQGC